MGEVGCFLAARSQGEHLWKGDVWNLYMWTGYLKSQVRAFQIEETKFKGQRQEQAGVHSREGKPIWLDHIEPNWKVGGDETGEKAEQSLWGFINQSKEFAFSS